MRLLDRIELINFAHGDVYALGFFISLTFFTWPGVPQALFVSLSVWQLLWMLPLVMLVTMLCTGLVNVSIDRLAYQAPTASTAYCRPDHRCGGLLCTGKYYAEAEWVLWLHTSILFSTKDVFLFGVTLPLLLALMGFVR